MARTKKAPVDLPHLTPMKKFTILDSVSGKRVTVELDVTKEQDPERRAMHLCLIQLQSDWKDGPYPDWDKCFLELEDGSLKAVPYF